MAHRFEAIEYLGYINKITKKPCRIVKAKYKDMELDVFYEDFESGYTYYRNLEYSYLTGYLVTFPGEKVKYRYSGESYIEKLQDWKKSYFSMNIAKKYNRNENDYLLLMEGYPEYKFMLKKLMKLSETYYISLQDIFGCMRLYKDYPEMEYLICHEYFYLIGNVSIYKYRKNNKKLFMNYLLKHREYFAKNIDLSVRDIMKCAKNNINPELHKFFKKYPDDICKYLIKNDRWKLGESFYRDYAEMAKEMNHDMNDPYWKYPNDLKAAHDKVMKEKELSEINKQAAKQMELIKITKGLQKNNQQIGNFKIFVANSVSQFVQASDVLHQCLMRANYIDRVIKQECIIVMIWNDEGTPVATAEIGYDKKVRQFYGDEIDHENCKPEQKIQDMFYSWLEGCKFRKRKIAKA